MAPTPQKVTGARYTWYPSLRGPCCSHVEHYYETDTQIAKWCVLAILVSLSLLEFALEYCCDFMPYNQLFKPILKEEDATTVKEGPEWYEN